MTKCPKCKFYNICKGRLNETVENCVRFKSAEQTNEEWLKSMNTEQLAEALAWIEDRSELPTVRKENVKAFEEWLKQPHNESVTNCNE